MWNTNSSFLAAWVSSFGSYERSYISAKSSRSRCDFSSIPLLSEAAAPVGNFSRPLRRCLLPRMRRESLDLRYKCANLRLPVLYISRMGIFINRLEVSFHFKLKALHAIQGLLARDRHVDDLIAYAQLLL